MFDLTPAADEVVRLLDGVKDDQLDGPTPCPEYSVAAILDHFMGLTLECTWAADKTTPPDQDQNAFPHVVSAEHLDPDWRTLLPGKLAGMAAAWRRPSAWEGMTETGPIVMPAPMIAALSLTELVVHGWDLARATGQPFDCDPASAAAVLDLLELSITPEYVATRTNMFGPVVDVPPDAPDVERALGLAGRDPAWTPSQI